MAYRKMPPPQPHERISELATDLVGNRVVALHTVDPTVAHMVFMPIAFGALDGYRKSQLRRIAVFGVLGRHKYAGAINGEPMFIECCVWRFADFDRAIDLAEEARKVLRA